MNTEYCNECASEIRIGALGRECEMCNPQYECDLTVLNFEDEPRTDAMDVFMDELTEALNEHELKAEHSPRGS